VTDREGDDLNGVLLYDDMPVATLEKGDLFLRSSGELVGYVRRGFLYSMKGKRLVALHALTQGEAPSFRVKELLKL
jgi:hypothetical protein